MSLPSLRSKAALQKWELVGGVVGGFCTAVAILTPGSYKFVPAVLAASMGAFVAWVKRLIKGIEDQEKAARLAADNAATASRDADRQTLIAQIEERARQQGEEVEAIRRRADEQLRKVMQSLVDEIRDRHFQKVDPSEQHHHRVTLFRCVEAGGTDGQGKHLAIFA